MKLEAGKDYVFKDDAARDEYFNISCNEGVFNLYYDDGFELTSVDLDGSRGWIGDRYAISPREVRLFKEKESKPFDISEYEFSDKDVFNHFITKDKSRINFAFDSDLMPSDIIGFNKQDAEAIAKHFKLI